jgi:hypothetical protein
MLRSAEIFVPAAALRTLAAHHRMIRVSAFYFELARLIMHLLLGAGARATIVLSRL